MNVAKLQCPPQPTLRDFALGRLDAPSAETVGRHLQSCADCRQRIAMSRLRVVVGHAKPPSEPIHGTLVQLVSFEAPRAGLL